MFGFLKKSEDHAAKLEKERELVKEKLKTMNLTDIRSYLKDQIKDLEVSEFGLIEVMKKLVTEDEETKSLYINEDDMDSKKKKAFEIVLLLSTSSKITMVAIELIQVFIEVYQEIIFTYDRGNKDIYVSRLGDSIVSALKSVEKIDAIKNRINILDS